MKPGLSHKELEFHFPTASVMQVKLIVAMPIRSAAKLLCDIPTFNQAAWFIGPL